MDLAWWQVLGLSLHILGLTLVAGGTLALGAFTAPALFKDFPRVEAGDTMTTIFRRFDKVQTLCFWLILLAQGLLWVPIAHTGAYRLLEPSPTLAITYASLTGLCLILLAWSLFKLNPKLEEGQQEGIAALPLDDPRVVQFNKVHDLAEKVAKLIFLVAVVLLILLPWWLL